MSALDPRGTDRPAAPAAAKAPPPGVQPAGEEELPEGPRHVLLHVPVDIRNVSLAVLAVLASVVVLRWASAVFIPLMLGVMLSYALSPLVDGLQRYRLPRALSAGVLLCAILGGIGAGVYSLTDDTTALIERLPQAAQKLREAVRSRSGGPGPIEQVQKAATELQRATEDDRARPAAERGVTRVRVERERFDIKDYLWTGTLGLVSLVGQIVIVTFITFFLLASGDTFRRKLVKLAGPTLTQKRVTVQALDEIDAQIQRYLLVQLATSLLVGVATWAAFLWIGLEQAAVWGVAAGVLNMIPYLGAIAVTGGSMLVGFLQFGTDMALLVGLISLVINTLEGYLLTPWLTSRVGRMNPVAVFVGVLAWGWLWGGWGLVLGVPILMVIKAICDRVDSLKPIGELLGR